MVLTMTAIGFMNFGPDPSIDKPDLPIFDRQEHPVSGRTQRRNRCRLRIGIAWRPAVLDSESDLERKRRRT